MFIKNIYKLFLLLLKGCMEGVRQNLPIFTMSCGSTRRAPEPVAQKMLVVLTEIRMIIMDESCIRYLRHSCKTQKTIL